MAASKNNNAHTPELTLPASIAQTMRLVQRVAHSAALGERIARQHLPPSAADFGPRLFRRFDAAHAPGQWADNFAQRFVADELTPASSELTLAPHAPAQRQVSSARQGALAWSSGDAFSSSGSSFPAGSIARSSDTDTNQSLIGDLMASGWSVESVRSNSLRRSAEPSSQTSAPVSSRLDGAQARTHQPSEPIRRLAEPQPAVMAPLQTTVNRQAEPAAVSSSESSSAESETAASSTQTGTAFDAPGSTPDSTTPASETTSPIQTAAARPMTFFRGTPQNPLMRMGLPESAGSTDGPAGPTASQLQSPSGNLPVVRPARGSDEPLSSDPVPTSTAINRRSEQPPVAASTNVTSSNTSEQTSASGARPDTSVSPEIQREPITDPASITSQPQAASSDSAQPATPAEPTASNSAPADVQRQAASESSATPGLSGVDKPISRSESATGTTASAADAPPMHDQAQRANQPAAQTAVQHTEVAAAATNVDQAPASGDSTAQAATPPVQRAATAESDVSDTSSVDASTPPEDTVPAIRATAQRSPLIHRKPAQPAQASAIDTVLPLANKLLQRYSAGDTPDRSGPMPLLRTFAPASARAETMSGPASAVQVPGSSAATSTSSAGSGSTPPLVHRSPIVPLLPAATIHREPVSSAPAATPLQPRSAVAPALEWSALPLLHRLSHQHALPTPPAVSRTADPGSIPAATSASVATHVIDRFALDAASGAPMPLLRMQSSANVMRTQGEATADNSAGLGSDAPTGQNFTNDYTGADNTGFDIQPGVKSTDSSVQTVPLIHRSAILPSLSGAASQPLTLLRVHIPAAPGTAQADPTPAAGSFQSLPTLGSGTDQTASPIMRRSPEHRSEASLDLAASNQPESSEMTSTSSVGSGSTPPLVHRSPIVPLLPAATIHREPVSSAPAATPSQPRSAVAPALEWSALPLLHRLSHQHALPTPPAVSRTADPGSIPAATSASVATHVIDRFALDAASGAPMPLLRMQAIPEAPILSRESEPAGTERTESSTSNLATEAPAVPPSVLSSFVRRSPILPSLPSFAAQEPGIETPAPQAAETRSESAQRSEANDWSAIPMLQRTSIQRLFGSRLSLSGLKMPSLGGIQNSVNSLAGQARSMTNIDALADQAQSMTSTEMPNLPLLQNLPWNPQQAISGVMSQATGTFDQLQGQAQGMVDQVTGLPGQLQGQAQGMVDQVTGLPGQLQGQAQGMIDQVTGLPRQMLGQAQGMVDQVTGLPGQLQGQAQGMIDQVTGLPRQMLGQAQGAFDQMAGLPGQMQEAAGNLAGGRSSQLTLLRPVRGESQSAPVKDENEPDAETGSQSQQPTDGSSTQAKGESGKQAKPDIEVLAQQVYARLRHRLLIDRERLGR